MQLKTAPPIFQTNLTPTEIIGYNNLDTFQRFYSIACSESNGGEYPTKRLKKEIGEDQLRGISETMRHLRDHGYYASGQNPDGSIKWSYQTKSASHILYDKGMPELDGKSFEELKAIARRGYSQIVENVTVEPKQSHEMNLQWESQ